MLCTFPNQLAATDWPNGVRLLVGSVNRTNPPTMFEPEGRPTVVPLLKGLNDWLKWTTVGRPFWAADGYRGNLFPFLTPGPPGGIEEAGSVMVINDMLLLATAVHGDGSTALNRSNAIIRLFPLWRYAEEAGPASFHGLRTKGAFQVDAAYDNATDEVFGVFITSDAGNPCAILSPWDRATGPGSVAVTLRSHAGPVATVPVEWDLADRRGAVFRFATVAGGVYDVEPIAIGRPDVSQTAAAATQQFKTTDDSARVVVVAPGGDELRRCIASGAERCHLLPGIHYESAVVDTSRENSLEITGTLVSGKTRSAMSGALPVPGPWVRHKGSIFKTQLPPNLRLSIQQAWAGDTWLPEARWPNTNLTAGGPTNAPGGPLSLTSWAKTFGKASQTDNCTACTRLRLGEIVDPALASTAVNWTGALATLNVGFRFYTWTRRVEHHVPGSDRFSYNPHAGPGRHVGGNGAYLDKGLDNRYFLSGKLEALDAPGEYFIDEASWVMYVWAPDSAAPSSVQVKVKAHVRGGEGLDPRSGHVRMRLAYKGGRALGEERVDAISDVPQDD
eukprot:SAG11_NODE_819_length_7017_cov_3.801821_2_plen_559_part_00